MLRVLHICQRDAPATGGALRVAEALFEAQRAGGIDARILFLYGEAGCIARKFESNAVCLGLDSSRQCLTGLKRLGAAIQRIDPTIIHSHDGTIWPRLAYWSVRVSIVTHAHLPPEPSSVKQRLGWWLTKRTTDLLIGISKNTAQRCIDAGFDPTKVRLISNGVDFERFCIHDEGDKQINRMRFGLPQEKKILLWVGRLHREMKGTDRLERIVALLPKEWVLVVVGMGPEFEAIQRRCASYIRDGKLALLGALDQPENAYALADAFLFSSHHEPFGLVILEAVASGLPILTFPVDGGANDLLDEFGAVRLSDTPTQSDVDIAFESLSLHREDRAMYRSKAMKTYSWRAVADQVNIVYSELLSEGKRNV